MAHFMLRSIDMMMLSALTPRFSRAIAVKRTPSWAGWSTVCVGFLSSLAFNSWLPPSVFGIGPQEKADYALIGGTLVNVVVCSLWFLGTTFFAKRNAPEYTKQEEDFFERLNTPVVSSPEQTRHIDFAQLNTLSWLCIPYGAFIMLLGAIPNPLEGRLGFVFSGSIIVGVGAILRRKGRRLKATGPTE